MIQVDNPLMEHVMSVSSLNLFAQSPAAYREHVLRPVKEETTYFLKGSAVDCLITEPEEFDNKFAVIKTGRPSGMMGDLCKLMHDYMQVNNDGLPVETLFNVAFKKVGFKLKEETVWKKYNAAEIQNYMRFLQNSVGKSVITEFEHEQALDVVSMLQNSEHTRYYMKDCSSNTMVDVHDQLRVDFVYNDIACKGFLDRVIVDHHNKTIQPIDLKTTGKSVLEFRNSFMKFGYFRQGAFYQTGIKAWIKTQPEIQEYELKNFMFIVAEMECMHLPVIYRMTDNDLKVSEFGGFTQIGSPVKGFQQLIDEVKWHRQTDIWNMKAEDSASIKNTGAVELDMFK